MSSNHHHHNTASTSTAMSDSGTTALYITTAANQWLQSCQDILSQAPSSLKSLLPSSPSSWILSQSSSNDDNNNNDSGDNAYLNSLSSLSSILPMPSKLFLSITTAAAAVVILSVSTTKFMNRLMASRAIMQRQHMIDLMLRNATNHTTVHFSLQELLNLCTEIYWNEYQIQHHQQDRRHRRTSRHDRERYESMKQHRRRLYEQQSASFFSSLFQLISLVGGSRRSSPVPQLYHTNQLPCCLIAIYQLFSRYPLLLSSPAMMAPSFLPLSTMKNYNATMEVASGGDDDGDGEHVLHDFGVHVIHLLKRFFISYEPRLHTCIQHATGVDNNNGNSGDSGGSEWINHNPNSPFHHLVRGTKKDVIMSLEETVDLNLLFSGLSGADFQPFIQYAYGTIAGNVATQRDALQYMQLSFQSLENHLGNHLLLFSSSPTLWEHPNGQQLINHQPYQLLQNQFRKLGRKDVDVVKRLNRFQVQYAQAIDEFDVIEILNGMRQIFVYNRDRSHNGGASTVTNESRTSHDHYFNVGHCPYAQLSRKLGYLSTESPAAPLFQALRVLTLSDHNRLHADYLLEKLTLCTLLMLIENGVDDYDSVQLVCLVHAARVTIQSFSYGHGLDGSGTGVGSGDSSCSISGLSSHSERMEAYQAQQQLEQFAWNILRHVWSAILGVFLLDGMLPQIPTTLDLETKGVKRVEDVYEWEDIIALFRNIVAGDPFGELQPPSTSSPPQRSNNGGSQHPSSWKQQDPSRGLEHSIKLIFCCEEQSRAYPHYQFLFRYIASERIKMHI